MCFNSLFFCQTGLIYNIFNVPRAIILNSNGSQFDSLYVFDSDSDCAKWLGKFRVPDEIIHADSKGTLILASQGHIFPYSIDKYWLDGKFLHQDGYVYLSSTNILNNKLKIRPDRLTNTSEFRQTFFMENSIYNAGNSIILYKM